jgi:hypothetical protein
MENLDGLVIDAHLPRPIDASADCGPRSPGSLGVNRRVGSCSAPFHQRTAASQRLRKRIEEAFAWIQATAGQNRRTEENQIPRLGARQGFPLRGSSL